MKHVRIIKLVILFLVLGVFSIKAEIPAVQGASGMESSRTGEVVFMDKNIFEVMTFADGQSPVDRARKINGQLARLAAAGGDLEGINLINRQGVIVAEYGDLELFTVTGEDARAAGLPPEELARIWSEKTREALQEACSQVVNTLNGEASWYGSQFHGRRTASGAAFDKNELTAAHKSLPFGSQVLVTNSYNGKSVLVKITDRGPFIKDRIIDLSQAAAEKIGMTGTANVLVEVLK